MPGGCTEAKSAVSNCILYVHGLILYVNYRLQRNNPFHNVSSDTLNLTKSLSSRLVSLDSATKTSAIDDLLVNKCPK